jgi:hypothetical protein
MRSANQTTTESKARLWTARILSGIAVLFLLFDSAIHLMVIPPVVEAFTQLGLSINLAIAIGIIELVCLVLYIVPPTSIVGAILLTGYLGGAVAIQLRVGAPLFGTALFPIYIGILVWGGLFLRDGYLRTIIPFRTQENR